MRVGKKFRKIVTIAMSALLIAETLNLTGIAAKADSIDSAEELNVLADSEIATAVESAETADEAAYAAAQLADAALAAANAIASAANNAVDTEADGTFVLDSDLDEAITAAETEVAAANTEIDGIKADAEDDIADIAADAKADTEAQLDIAAAAVTAAEAKADDAEAYAKKAQECNNYFEATQYAAKAQTAADEAQKEADKAEAAYNSAAAIYSAAETAFNAAVDAANLEIETASADAVQAVEDAQAELDAAKAAVAAAAAAYEAATGISADAMNAAASAATTAENAAAEAGVASEVVTEALAQIKEGTDTATLKSNVADAQDTVASATDAQTQVTAEQQAIIDAANARIAELNAEIAALKDNKYRNAVKYVDEHPLLFWSTKYKESKKVIAEVDEKVAIKNVAIAEEQKKIADAKGVVAGADQAVADAKIALAEAQTALAAVTDFLYTDDAEVIYLDKDDQAKYAELLADMQASYDEYADVKDLRESYEDAIDRSGDGFIKWIKELYEELSLEVANNGAKLEMDWSTFSLKYTNNGLTLLIGRNKDNVETLVAVENGKLSVVTVDEAEFAAYSASFDAVAAAQAANKAAQAAQDEAAAKAKYDAAVAALAAAQARLDAAVLNSLSIDAALADMEAAKDNVDAAKLDWDAAQKAADRAKDAADAAKKTPDDQPVVANFFVLNRNLVQPSEVYSYPKGNYGKAIAGELFAGVYDEATGTTDRSYVPVYNKGIKDETVIPGYLKTAPTNEQMIAAGVDLKEGEYVKWYVIKKEADGYHVDGIIMNQKYTITVKYGYEDEDGKFVAFTDAEGKDLVTSEVHDFNTNYSIVSPVIEDYVADTAVVEGVCTDDAEFTVLYTKEATAKVTINYYRGYVGGTRLASTEQNVAISKLATYGDVIKANWLNSYRPGDCYGGTLVSYKADADGNYVADIVYVAIPQVVPGTPEEPVIPEEPTAVPVVPPTTTPAATPEEEEIEVMEIPEEEIALAPTAEIEEVEEEEAPVAVVEEVVEEVEIEEEETPLVSGKGNCWIHWALLAAAIVYLVYELNASIKRARQIKELQDEKESKQAEA